MSDVRAGADADAWVKAVLGVDPADWSGAAKDKLPGTSPGGKPVAMGAADPGSGLSKSARDPKVWTQAVGKALTRQGGDKTGARMQQSIPMTTTACQGKDGRQVGVGKAADGRFVVTHPAPPIETVTFSGGGGKGAALPGAIKALTESGVLKGMKSVHGASVGSMTAAMVAAGVTPEDFKALSTDTDWNDIILGDLKDTRGKGEKNVGAVLASVLPVAGAVAEVADKIAHTKVMGTKLEAVVKAGMKSAIGKQIAAFAQAAMKAGTVVDKDTTAMLAAMTAKFAGQEGPSFLDLRVLSKTIPEIKEVVITGTMVAMKKKPKKGETPPEMHDQKPQSVVFSADTQPKMEVALAVHASASLPPLFAPVDILLQSGETGRFIDGGVLNNTPTDQSIGADRDVDPVPETGAITFMFQDENSENVLKGNAVAGSGTVLGKLGRKFQDAIAGAEFAATSYDTNRGLADRPEDVVMVPLKFTNAKGKKKDFSTLTGGTLKFDVAKDDRVMLEGMTEKATAAHIGKRKEPESRSYGSEGEMMACAPRADLAAMADSKYPGAADALTFRDEVDKAVAHLAKLAKSGAGPNDKKVQELLGAIDAMAAGDDDRIGYVGRTMNRTGALDGFLGKAAGPKMPASDSLAAGVAVAAVLAARKLAHTILREIVYPKMVRQDPDGVIGTLLKQMDVNLRDARSNTDINRTLRLGIAFFSKRKDPGGVLGHKDFAVALTKSLQKDE